MTLTDEITIDLVTDAVIECALCAELDDACRPLDERFSADDLDSDGLNKLRGEVAAFLAKAEPLLADLEPDLDMLGRDFWLSRNGHGTGFFDNHEAWADKCDALQSLAGSFGEAYLYTDDDTYADTAEDTDPVLYYFSG